MTKERKTERLVMRTTARYKRRIERLAALERITVTEYLERGAELYEERMKEAGTLNQLRN